MSNSGNEKSKALFKTSYIFRKLKASLDNQTFESHPDDDFPEPVKKISKHGASDFDLEPLSLIKSGPSSPVLDVTPLRSHQYIGSPEPEIRKTPYQIVKECLNTLKEELRISAPELEEERLDENASKPDYSLARVTPSSLNYVEEVVMELDWYLKSMYENISSDDMMGALMDFQTRLELPEFPDFYTLMQKSPYDFLGYLSQHEGGQNEADINVGVKHEGDEAGEAGPYDNLAPPLLSFKDAKDIIFEFVRRLQKGKQTDTEADFLKLQSDLKLPDWLSLYDFYVFQQNKMTSVVSFLIKYFTTSKVASKKEP